MPASRRWQARAALPGLLLALVGGLPEIAQPANYLVVMLDDVGVDKIAAYGEASVAVRTPHLDALARDGVLFRNAWSNPTCSPSRVSALVGRRPELTGIGAAIVSRSPGLSSEEVSLAQVLSDQGYSTAAFGKWHLGHDPGLPSALGFDTHRGTLGNIGRRGYSEWRKYIDGVDAGWNTTYATTDTVNDAIQWIEAQQSPWFVWLAFHAVHRPLHEPPPQLHSYGVLDGRGAVRRYSAILEVLDTELSRVLAVVGPDTTIVVMGDNGTYSIAIEQELDGDRGKGTVYETGINVPLFVAGPDVASDNRGRESQALVHLSDLFATLSELVGSAASAEDSVSFVKQLVDASAPGREWLYTSWFRPNGGPPAPANYLRAARDARYKLLRLPGRELLFDLAADPHERTNLLDGALEADARKALSRLAGVIDSHEWRGQESGGSTGLWGAIAFAIALAGATGLWLRVRRHRGRQ